MLQWLSVLNARDKIMIYCSDVSGAFDRVSADRLIEKLRAKGVNERIVRLLASWLKDRWAKVVVGGKFSDILYLVNQVFQGMVLGPILRNIFFDTKMPIRKSGFHEIVFASDSKSSMHFSIRVSTWMKRLRAFAIKRSGD